jgi:hypothetical protein
MIKTRNEFVLVKIITKGETTTGIALPDASQEGKDYIVMAIGPKVEDLDVGDKIMVIGQANSTFAFLPSSNELFITSEAFIPYRIVFGEDEFTSRANSKVPTLSFNEPPRK